MEEEYEKLELELDERELLREWEEQAEMEEAVEKGDEEREGMISLSREGLVSCAIMLKICSSSSNSFSISC